MICSYCVGFATTSSRLRFL